MTHGRSRKIVLIGAGSAVFTRGLVADLILSPELLPAELCLVDISPEALATAEGLSRRMIEARGADIKVRASTDRRAVLADADVVICTIGVGGRRGWEADAYIPRKYGIYQPVGDSVMPGGISRAMRMVPALVSIAEDVQDLCPEAWFFNYSNPMTVNCWAIAKATGLRVTGLCHAVFRIEHELAEFIGAPKEEVTSMAVGLNHLTFFVDLRRNGRDAWPIVRERVAKANLAPADTEGLGKTFQPPTRPGHNPFSWSLFETYGAYPAANDRHVIEFFPERFRDGDYHGMKLGIEAFSVEDIIAWGDVRYEDMRAQATGEKPLDEGIFERTVGEHEQLLSIIRSIDGDKRQVFSMNLRNEGAVPNLPDDAVLELPAVATARGPRAIAMPDLPAPVAALLERKLAANRLTVEAALAGDRRLYYEALLADGAVTDPGVAQRLGDELLEAHREHLPTMFQT